MHKMRKGKVEMLTLHWLQDQEEVGKGRGAQIFTFHWLKNHDEVRGERKKYLLVIGP